MVSVKRHSKRKQDVIQEASKAAIEGLGFFASISIKTGNIAEGLKVSSDATTRLVDLVSKLFLDTKVEEQKKVDYKQLLETQTATIKKRGLDLAALGLLIPFLFSEDAKKYLGDFITGLFGLGPGALDKVKLGINAVLGVLAGVFAYKVFKQVGDTINALRTLATITGTLFGITEAAATDVSDSMDELDKDKEKKAAEKKEVDRTKKETKGLKDELKKEKKKYPKGVRGKISKAIDFVFKIGPKVGKGLLKALPVVGTIATIGYLLYEVYDEAVNFFSDEDKEEKPEQETQSEVEEKPSIAATQTAVPEPAGVEGLPKETAPSEITITKQAEEVPVEKASITSSPLSIKPPEALEIESAVEEKPAPFVIEDEVEPFEVSSPILSEEQIKNLPEIVPADSAVPIIQASEEIVRARKEKSSLVLINNIDNSVLVSKAPESAPVIAPNYAYSTKVGT